MNSERDATRRQLKKYYATYLRVKSFVNSGGWYGDWSGQFKKMEVDSLEAWRGKVSELMKKLGYDSWTDKDVERELQP